MAPRSLTGRRITLLLLACSIELAISTDCYYPNGGLSPNNNDQPCSNVEGSACCPENWQCLDNGLCYYPDNDQYGRYGCTDKTWQSPYCASSMCTYNMTAAGDEAITQCSSHNNQWCCDGDRIHVDCCTDNSRPFFDLADGKAYATVGGSLPSTAPTLNTILGPATSGDPGDGGGSPQTTAAGSSSGSPSSGSPSSVTAAAAPSSSSSSGSPTSSGNDESKTTGSKSASAVTSLKTSLSTGTGGVATVVITQTFSPSSTVAGDSANAQPSTKHDHIGLIVGCAVGIPLVLAAVGVLFLLYRRRQKKQHRYSTPSTPDPYANGTFSGGKTKLHRQNTYKSEADMVEANMVPELASQPLGPGRPISTIPGRSELAGNGTYIPGHTPQSSIGSAPPSYSPGQAQGGWGPGRYAESAGTAGGLRPVSEQEANMTAGGRYAPYRPPHANAAPQTEEERYELPSVRTPPA